MMLRACLLVLGVLFAAAAAAETVYKYRQPDGKMIYSNRLIPGAELVETFEYRFPKAVAPDPKAKKRADEVDQRIQKHLLALDRAWTEVQDATRALTAAEEKLRAGVEPQPGDRAGVTGDTIPPVVGGAGPSASPAIGGSMSGRRGRASPEYVARIQALEGAVQEARAPRHGLAQLQHAALNFGQTGAASARQPMRAAARCARAGTSAASRTRA